MCEMHCCAHRRRCSAPRRSRPPGGSPRRPPPATDTKMNWNAICAIQTDAFFSSDAFCVSHSWPMGFGTAGDAGQRVRSPGRGFLVGAPRAHHRHQRLHRRARAVRHHLRRVTSEGDLAQRGRSIARGLLVGAPVAERLHQTRDIFDTTRHACPAPHNQSSSVIRASLGDE